MKSLIAILILVSAYGCGAKNTSAGNNAGDALPVCVNALIKKFQGEPVQNPPRRIYSCVYNDSVVYYVPAICCDFYSDLYDGNCRLIGHPDGGFTGRGDGTASDFMKVRTNEKLVWKDSR